MAELCGSTQDNNRKDGSKYVCQKEKGHNGHHVYEWTEKGIVHIDGIKQEGDIKLMTWW